jgi:hypothetical protein
VPADNRAPLQAEGAAGTGRQRQPVPPPSRRTVKRLFMGAVRQLLAEQSTQEAAFDEISQLLITASPILAKSLAEEVLPHIKPVLPALEEHCIWWMRALDGSMEKRSYPNLKTLLQRLKIRNEDR